MKVNESTVVALVQAGKFVLDTLEMYQMGELSDEEAEERIAKMKLNVRSANEAWEAAEELVRLSQPLYTVAFGPVGDVRYARDLAVVNLPDQYSVFAKNELMVQAT